MSRIVSGVGIAVGSKKPKSRKVQAAMEIAILNAQQQGIEDQAEIKRLMNAARIRVGGKARKS